MGKKTIVLALLVAGADAFAPLSRARPAVAARSPVAFSPLTAPVFTAAAPVTGHRAATAIAAAAAAAADADVSKSTRPEWAPTPTERKKLLPLGLMFFCILFNYTILRDTKDVLVVTAKGSGAEIIPFLKTYVQLPGAIAFTVLYSKMSNKMSQEKVFYSVLYSFLAFFALFALAIYPNAGLLHPHGAADALAAALPVSFAGPIAIFRNWSFALFYMMAELWGSVVVSVLFWGLANRIMSVTEAKRYYPLFGLGANVALIFSGQYVRFVSAMRANLAPGADPWAQSLKYLMGAVCASGTVIGATMRHVQKNVMTDPACVDQSSLKKATKKTSMGLVESAKYLASSKYIRNLAMLVIGYGMSINIVEVTWKARLKAQFADPNAYSAFMGAFSSTTGAVTLLTMLASRTIFAKLGWGFAAAVTPMMVLTTGGVFFSQVLFPNAWLPLAALVGTTPLMLSVLVGAAQNILSKSSKYALFDPCKEMAYIPLDAEQKSKGKAAIDVIGNPLGKSGGSFVQQLLIFGLGSLAASAPYLCAVLLAVTTMWLGAARQLAPQYEDAVAQMQDEIDAEEAAKEAAKAAATAE